MREHEFHGWVMEYDAASFQQKGVFNTSRNWIFDATRADVEGAGVWQSGAGLLADGSGAVYLTTGNGKKVLEGHYFGDLVLKVRDGLPRDHSASFTPSELGLKEVTYALDGAAPPNVYHYKVNANGDPRHLQVSCNPEPAGTKVLERANDISYLLDFQDLDLSSGGPMLIPGTSILVAGGKTGVMYLLDSSTMQRIQEFAFSTDLDAPCRRYDFQNGPHLHGAPTYWSISDSLAYIYHWGEKDFLRGYPFVTTTGKVDTEHPICSFRRSIQNTADPGSASKCQTPSGSILFERVRASKCQMPGGSISVSGNQSGGTAVIWATTPLDRGETFPLPEADNTDCSQTFFGGGLLLAFDATNLELLKTIALPDLSHFQPPTVADGKVFVATASDNGRWEVHVYGIVPLREARQPVVIEQEYLKALRTAGQPRTLKYSYKYARVMDKM